MDDLISRRAAIEAIEKHKTEVLGQREWDEGIAFGYEAAHRHLAEVITKMPTADVPGRKVWKWLEPTREGCITYDKQAYAECSACGEKAYLGWWMHYCPNCGARMKGEDDATVH